MIKWLHKSEEAVLCLLLTTLTILVFCEAILRKLGIATLWMEETVKWNAAWFILFGASYGVRTGAHIGLTVISDKISHPGLKRALAIIAILVCIAFSALFLGSSWQYVSLQKMFNFPMDDLPFPQWVPYSGLLVGFALLLIRFAIILFKLVTGEINSLTYADEAKESIENLAQPVVGEPNS